MYFSISLFLADKLTRDDDRIYVIGTHEHTHTRTHTHRDPDSTYTNTPTVHYSTALRLCQIGLVEQYWVAQNNKHTLRRYERGGEDKKEDKGRGMSGHEVDCQHQLSSLLMTSSAC